MKQLIWWHHWSIHPQPLSEIFELKNQPIRALYCSNWPITGFGRIKNFSRHKKGVFLRWTVDPETTLEFKIDGKDIKWLSWQLICVSPKDNKILDMQACQNWQTLKTVCCSWFLHVKSTHRNMFAYLVFYYFWSVL